MSCSRPSKRRLLITFWQSTELDTDFVAQLTSGKQIAARISGKYSSNTIIIPIAGTAKALVPVLKACPTKQPDSAQTKGDIDLLTQVEKLKKSGRYQEAIPLLQRIIANLSNHSVRTISLSGPS